MTSPLRYRQLDELTPERGVVVEHATTQRWVLQSAPPLEAAFHRRQRPGWSSGRMDAPSIRIRTPWGDLDRAVGRPGQSIAFLLTEQRDEQAALRVLTRALRRHGVPVGITIAGSQANAAAIAS